MKGEHRNGGNWMLACWVPPQPGRYLRSAGVTGPFGPPGEVVSQAGGKWCVKSSAALLLHMHFFV